MSNGAGTHRDGPRGPRRTPSTPELGHAARHVPVSGGEDCYWARLDENQDIVDNYLGSGPSVLVVKESDAFVELSRCTWTLSG